MDFSRVARLNSTGEALSHVAIFVTPASSTTSKLNWQSAFPDDIQARQCPRHDPVAIVMLLTLL